jgi:hypothetical protein
MVLEEVWALYEHFREFIHTFELSIVDHELQLKFMIWNYELIDADLDQDETSYTTQMHNFEKCLELYIRELIHHDTIKQCHLTKYHMEFRHEFKLDEKKVFKKEQVDGKILVSATTTKYYDLT